MSQIDRIAEINRLNNQLMIKNDRISRNAHKPDQTVRKMMTPTENEIIEKYEQDFPSNFIVETGEVDANGNPITKYRKYMMPDAEPELEQEPHFITDEEKRRKEQTLEDEYKRVLSEDNELMKMNKTCNGNIAALKAKMNNNEISQAEYIAHLNQLKETADNIKKEIDVNKSRIYQLLNIKENLNTEIQNSNAKVYEVRDRNAMKVEEYRKELSILNQGAFNTSKGQNETESDYLTRLRNTAETEDPENELATAVAMINKKFRLKMKELISDVSKIEQVANSLDDFGKVENKFKLLKLWTLIKQRFLGTYGADNKRLTPNDILNFMRAFLTTGKSGLPVEVNKIIHQPVGENRLGQLSYSVIQEDNTFMITNNATGKNLFLKPLLIQMTQALASSSTKYALLYSFTGLQKSYKQFFEGHRNSSIPPDRNKLKSSKEIFDNTGISKEQLLELFKQKTPEISADNICKILVKDYNLTPKNYKEEGVTETKYSTNKGAESGIQYGWGIKAETMPKVVPFGNIFLYLHKLYYENVLSIRNKNNKVIAGFRTMKVSEQFVKLITNMLKGLHPTHSDLDSLKTGERQVYDRLIALAKLNKDFVTQKDQSIKDLKKRLKLLEAEIEIGNNSPLIKKEIYGILHSLNNFKVITQSQINKYLEQIK